MNIEKVNDLKLNYLELAYIQDISVEESKEIFEKLSGRKVVREWTLVKVEVLKQAFGDIKSLDKRYDGENQLVFNLIHKSEQYKKHLCDEVFIISGKFQGGKSVLLKIMNNEQLRHLYSVRKEKYNNIINALNLGL